MIALPLPWKIVLAILWVLFCLLFLSLAYDSPILDEWPFRE